MIADTDVDLPKRQTKNSAGYDFYMPYGVDLRPGEWTKIDTGVRLTDEDWASMATTDFSDGTHIRHEWHGSWFMILAPRSGLGSKYGFRMRNTIGIIDKDYRDNILATVTVDKPLSLKKGDRFMQGILIPNLIFGNEVTPERTRSGGHGSTGV